MLYCEFKCFKHSILIKSQILDNFVYISFNFRIQCTTATRNYSDALKHKEAPIVDNEVILSDKEIKERERLSYLISLPKEVSVKSMKKATTKLFLSFCFRKLLHQSMECQKNM